MSLKEKLLSEGVKLASNPSVTKLLQDERVTRLLLQTLAVPGKVAVFTQEQKENLARTLGFATAEEVRDLRRMVLALEEELTRLRRG